MNGRSLKIDIRNCFYYPDVVVDCGAFDKASVFTSTPLTIVEVVSRSTASTDRREKLVAYQHLGSLNQYVIVYQTRKRVDVYRRVGDDWTVEEIGISDALVLEISKDLPITISMDEIYADIEFDEGPDLQVREDVEVYTW